MSRIPPLTRNELMYMRKNKFNIFYGKAFKCMLERNVTQKITISLGKKVGNAVKRNKYRRSIHEYIRKNYDNHHYLWILMFKSCKSNMIDYIYYDLQKLKSFILKRSI